MTKYEILTLSVQGLSILFLALTVLYASLQLRSVRKTNSQTHDWNRRNAAQEMCVKYAEFNPNDEIVVREFWATTMNNVYLMLRPYIVERRKDQSAIWEYVEEYANKWQHEKQATDSRGHVA